MGEILGQKHEFRVEFEQDKPKNHKVKDKNGVEKQPMSPQEVEAMWTNGNVKAIGVILQAPVGSECAVVIIGGTPYKICP